MHRLMENTQNNTLNSFNSYKAFTVTSGVLQQGQGEVFQSCGDKAGRRDSEMEGGGGGAE